MASAALALAQLLSQGWREGSKAVVAGMIVHHLGSLSWWWLSSMERQEVTKKSTGHGRRAQLSDNKAENTKDELVNV